MDDNRLFKFLQGCQREYYKPDVHSFYIDIKDGRAFVDCRGYEVYIETYNYEGEMQSTWCGTTVAAANRLEMFGAVYETIDM